MFSDEIQQINDGISEAEGILHELLKEGLIENAYGDDIRRALANLSEAEDAAVNIENEDDPNENVDLEDMAYTVKKLREEIDNAQAALNDVEEYASDLSMNLRDYR